MDDQKQKQPTPKAVPQPSEVHDSEKDKAQLTIDDLGWTEEQAAEIRGLLAAFAPDWDDPNMDVFDEY